MKHLALLISLLFSTAAFAQQVPSNSQITQLPQAIPLAGSELTAVVQMGQTRKTTVSSFFAIAAQNLPLAAGDIFVGSVSGVAVGVPMSGDCSLSSSGAITCNPSGGVTSFSAGTTGLTPNIATDGTVILSGILNVTHGGTGTSSPGLVAGTNITVTGSWPNQTINSTASGSGSVTSVSVVTANGVSGTVATATTTPAITLALGAIVPSSVNGVTITNSNSPTWTIGSASGVPVVTASSPLVITSATGNITCPTCNTSSSNVISVSNVDGTITVSPTTGVVVASLALGHANTWSGQQSFVAPILGTPASGVATNLTGTAASLTAGSVSTISGLIVQGTNVTITGSGTIGSPYSIAASGGSGSVTSVATTAPITGGTITTTGTIACASCVTSSAPGSGIAHFAGSTQAVTSSAVSLTADVSGIMPVANGGTNAGSASITAFNNITGYTASGATGTTSTNIVFSTSPTLITPALGTPSALVGTNITGTAASLTAGAATTAGTLTGALSANQLLGSLTAIAPTGQTVPSCSTASSALLWTSGTGFSCNTSITAAAVPASGLTGTTLASNVVTSSLTTVGTIATGVWSGTALLAAKIPADVAYLDVAQAFTAGQAVTKSTPAISTATFTPNFAASTNFDIGLIHASCPCTLANPTNIVAGQSGVIGIIQSATGGDTITTYGTDYIFTNTTAPTLSSTASAVDYYSYYVEDSTHIRMSFLPATAAISETATPTAGTSVTSCTCATGACTNLRGSLTIVGGTATTGTICSLAWTATPAAYVCTATMNGGTGFLGIGNSVASTTGVNITAGVTVVGTTFTVNYSCQP